MKRILVLFAAMMMCVCTAMAQVGSSGHFSFEIPDDWEFMNYDGDEGWYAEDGALFMLEYDYTKYGLFDQETILDMYCKGKDIETFFDEFRYDELNGEPAAYYSTNKGIYCFEYYQNGYAITLLYSDKRGNTRRAEEILLPIAATVKYETTAQSGYQMVEKQTESFRFGIPDRWVYLENEGNHYAFNGEIGELENGYYCVYENAIPELSGQSEEVVRAAMEMVKTSFTDTLEFYGEEYAEHFVIDGCPAYLCHGFGKYGSFMYTSILLCARGDQMIMCTYMNWQEAFDKNFHTGLIEALAGQVKPL